MAELHLPGHGWWLQGREKVPLHLCIIPRSSSSVFLAAKENKKLLVSLSSNWKMFSSWKAKGKLSASGEIPKVSPGNYVPGTKIRKLCVRGCLFHPVLSVWVLCQGCWVGLWLLFLLRFVLCGSISDSSVFGLTRVLERPEKVKCAAASSLPCWPQSQESFYLFSPHCCRLQRSQESSSSGEL